MARRRKRKTKRVTKRKKTPRGGTKKAQKRLKLDLNTDNFDFVYVGGKDDGSELLHVYYPVRLGMNLGKLGG